MEGYYMGRHCLQQQSSQGMLTGSPLEFMQLAVRETLIWLENMLESGKLGRLVKITTIVIKMYCSLYFIKPSKKRYYID